MEGYHFRQPKNERTQWKKLFGYFSSLQYEIVVGFLSLLFFGVDKILVMDQGRLVEHGARQQLRQKRGSYRTLYKKQGT